MKLADLIEELIALALLLVLLAGPLFALLLGDGLFP